MITGRSGSGKTSYLLSEIEAGSFDVVFIFDDEHEFAQRLGLPILASLGELAFQGPPRKPTVICYADDTSSVNDAFDEFCLFVFEYARVANQRILLVVDELQRYVNAYIQSEAFTQCLFRGRRYGLSLLLASQQANLIHNSIRSSITSVVSFAQADINATKFARNLGIEGVEDLPDLEFISKTVGADKLDRGRIEFKGDKPFVTLLQKTDVKPKVEQQLCTGKNG